MVRVRSLPRYARGRVATAPKGAKHAEILRAIRAVGGGEAIFSPAIARWLMEFVNVKIPWLMAAWDTGGEVKEDAHPEPGIVECQA
jgi:hypothetical protein